MYTLEQIKKMLETLHAQGFICADQDEIQDFYDLALAALEN